MLVYTAKRIAPFVRCAISSSILFGASPLVHALTIVAPGQTETLNPGAVLDSWELQTGATLNVNAANTQTIRATGATLNVTAGSATQGITLGDRSQADISGANIIADTGDGLSLTASSAQIVNSVIDATGSASATGMTLSTSLASGEVSSVSMSGGSVTGNLGGISTSAGSTLILNNVQVSGVGANSFGLRSFSSDISVSGGTLRGGLNGIQYFYDPTTPREGTLSLSGNQVTGGSGAAIAINGLGLGLVANIELLDGTTLNGGNGNALEIDANATANVLVRNSQLSGAFVVTDGSTGNFTFDGASLTGDVRADGTSDANVTLTNRSTLTGNLINVSGVTLADDSIWNMVASTTVGALSITDSIVKFGAANEFFQLNVGTLGGSGTFVMDVDFATNQHDVLNVTGVATGNHTLAIEGSGVDPVSPERLTMVKTAGGDASFSLVNGVAVDVGTYSYDLASIANGSGGTDWYLDPNSRTISPGTASVLALFNTAPTVWYGELSSLRSRMGELRFNGGASGGWIRSYGNKYNVDQATGVGYQQSQQGFSLGADAPLPVGDGQWLVGVLAGTSNSDLNLNRGTSGTVKSYYAGVYTTWLDQQSGYYFDGVVKLNRFRNDAKVSMSDGNRAKGDYDNVGLGGSVEFGRHIKLDDGYFVEPFTQLSAVVIQGKDYGLDNGMEAEGDRTRSLLGKVGVTAGRNFALQDGKVVQPYVRVAGVHEFAKNNEVQVNNNVFNNDLSGSRGELGAGVAVAFSETFQMHADFDYANGGHIEQPFGANVGLRYSW